ncbi:MAG: c-type cytochrome, partial [Planctomycetota bacterium JB042]
MSGSPDPGLAPRSNRALVLGLVAGLVGAAGLGTWFVVHEGARARGASTTGDSTAAPLVRGEQVYGLCANCHGLGGGGQLGRAPALLGSPWLDADPLTRLVLHGFAGPDP